MTVEELIEHLRKMPGNAVVTICNLENDDDESFHFDKCQGIEIIETTNLPSIVALYHTRVYPSKP